MAAEGSSKNTISANANIETLNTANLDQLTVHF